VTCIPTSATVVRVAIETASSSSTDAHPPSAPASSQNATVPISPHRSVVIWPVGGLLSPADAFNGHATVRGSDGAVKPAGKIVPRAISDGAGKGRNVERRRCPVCESSSALMRGVASIDIRSETRRERKELTFWNPRSGRRSVAVQSNYASPRRRRR